MPQRSRHRRSRTARSRSSAPRTSGPMRTPDPAPSPAAAPPRCSDPSGDQRSKRIRVDLAPQAERGRARRRSSGLPPPPTGVVVITAPRHLLLVVALLTCHQLADRQHPTPRKDDDHISSSPPLDASAGPGQNRTTVQLCGAAGGHTRRRGQGGSQAGRHGRAVDVAPLPATDGVVGRKGAEWWMTAGIVEVGTKNCARVRVCWIAVISRGHVGAQFSGARSRAGTSPSARTRARAPQVPLPDTLAIVLLLARREPQHYSRAAARFVGRLALERPVDLGDLEAATVALLAHPTPAPPSCKSSANSGACPGDRHGGCRRVRAPRHLR